MVSFKKSVLTALLLLSGLTFTGCATAPQESSASDRLHTDRMMKVVERADTAIARRLNN